MAKKAKLSATLPDGTVATRTTARSYTHILAVAWDNAVELEREKESLAVIEGYIGNGRWTEEMVAPTRAKVAAMPTEGVTWTAYSWHGSEALAQKAADALRKRLTRFVAEIRLVPVDCGGDPSKCSEDVCRLNPTEPCIRRAEAG